MPLVLSKTRARFEDDCTVEDALPLLEFLKSRKNPTVDLAACRHLHTALLQLLVTVRPTVVALPADPLLGRWVSACLGAVPKGRPGAKRPRFDNRASAQNEGA